MHRNKDAEECKLSQPAQRSVGVGGDGGSGGDDGGGGCCSASGASALNGCATRRHDTSYPHAADFLPHRKTFGKKLRAYL